MFKDALKYSINFDKSINYIIGSILYIISSIFILPFILYYGYLIKVLRTTINGEEKPPSFTNITPYLMIMDGLKYAAIYLVYLLIVGIPYILLLNYSNINIIILDILLFATALIISYIFISSILVLSRTNKFINSFKLSYIKPILVSKSYFVAYSFVLILSIIISFAYLIGVLVLFFIPIIGWFLLIPVILLTPLGVFLYSLFVYRIYGLTYKEILKDTTSVN